jgi:hypothetical protein
MALWQSNEPCRAGPFPSASLSRSDIALPRATHGPVLFRRDTVHQPARDGGLRGGRDTVGKCAPARSSRFAVCFRPSIQGHQAHGVWHFTNSIGRPSRRAFNRRPPLPPLRRSGEGARGRGLSQPRKRAPAQAEEVLAYAHALGADRAINSCCSRLRCCHHWWRCSAWRHATCHCIRRRWPGPERYRQCRCRVGGRCTPPVCHWSRSTR